MDERTSVSTFDCDHQPQGSQPKVVAIHRTEQFMERYFPSELKKYPVLFSRMVTQEESNAIDTWLINKRYEENGVR